MRLPKRDIIATGLVAVAGLLYLLWALDAAPPGMSGARATGTVILVLGFAASASAVVPGVDQLVRGNKAYLAVTTLIGLVALAGGVLMLVNASGAGLGILMGATAVLWLIATIHHSLLAEAATASARRTPRPPRHGARPAGVLSGTTSAGEDLGPWASPWGAEDPDDEM